MKIEIEKIRDKAISLEENIPAKDWDLDSSDVLFVNDIKLKCDFTEINGEIVVDGEVATDREVTCSRCLGKVFKTIKQDFTKSYNIKDLGESLDIDNDVREEVLLDFPMKVLCKPDCRGICSGCGGDLNSQECNCQEYSDKKV